MWLPDICLLHLQAHANNLAQCADASSLQSCLQDLLTVERITPGGTSIIAFTGIS